MLTKNTPWTAPIGSCTLAHAMLWCLAYRKKPTTQPGLIGPLALWVCVSYCFSMWYRLFEFNRQFICFILAHHQFRISIMCRSIYSRCSVYTLERCMHQLAKFKWNVHNWTLNYFNNALSIITHRSAAHRLVMPLRWSKHAWRNAMSCHAFESLVRTVRRSDLDSFVGNKLKINNTTNRRVSEWFFSLNEIGIFLLFSQ